MWAAVFSQKSGRSDFFVVAVVEEDAFLRDGELRFRGVLPAVLVPGGAEAAEEFRLGVAGFRGVGRDAVDAEGVVGLRGLQ